MAKEKPRAIEVAKKLSVDLKKRLPSGFNIASISLEAKTPVKVMSWKGAILHRSSELANSTCNLYDAERYVSASLIARALMETSAMLFWLLHRIEKVFGKNNIVDIDDFVMRGLMGMREKNRVTADLPNALSALSAVDCVAKEDENFREMYNCLSEFAHPNWPGTFGAYGRNNKKKMYVEYGSNIRRFSSTLIPTSVVISLLLLQKTNCRIEDIFSKFTKLCEKKIKEKPVP